MIDYELFTNLYTICFVFIIGGLFVVLLTTYSQSSGAIMGTISGYSATLFATIILTIISISSITEANHTILQWIRLLLPFIFLIGILVTSLIIVGTNYTEIVKGQITGYYQIFAFISVIFTMLQMYLVLITVKTIEFQSTASFESNTFAKIILLGIFNIITLISLGIIVKNYSTDG